MSNERNDLAKLIFVTDNSGAIDPEAEWEFCNRRDAGMTKYAYDMADALIAAGYRKPRTITTEEELDALPFESVVRDAEGYVLERWGDPAEQCWAVPMNGAYVLSADITLPATVLHVGAPE